jgi:tRNA G26 N,N-dimethylase Trm1
MASSIPEGFTAIREGAATVLLPSVEAVFYNPAQIVNRDLSVAVIRAFGVERLADRRERAERAHAARLADAAARKPDEPAPTFRTS